jgi:hypothetical protein
MSNAQKILPVPFPASPTPTVPSASNYGSAPYPLPVKPSPNRVNDDLQYCNFLQPSPRDQRLNVPYEGHKDCPKFSAQPYEKDSCYLLDSKAQGTVGIVCNEPGGSDNADFIRGNQFGVDYPFNQDLNTNKKLEYTVEQPVQIPMELQNPSVIYDKNTFYPEQNFFYRGNKDYYTYPIPQNYTEYGLPKYTYPYKTMNPIFQDPNQTGIIESFSNNNVNKTHFFFILLIVIVMVFYFYNIM